MTTDRQEAWQRSLAHLAEARVALSQAAAAAGAAMEKPTTSEYSLLDLYEQAIVKVEWLAKITNQLKTSP